jgi:hypothetical protein
MNKTQKDVQKGLTSFPLLSIEVSPASKATCPNQILQVRKTKLDKLTFCKVQKVEYLIFHKLIYQRRRSLKNLIRTINLKIE